MIWRGVAGFFILLTGYLVAAMVIEFLTALAAAISHGWPEAWSRYFGAAMGAVIGVGAGSGLIVVALKTYPRRGVALAFVALNVVVIVGDLLYPAPTGGLQIARAVVTILATLAMIWPGKYGPPDQPPRRG